MFELRKKLTDDFSSYIKSFINIKEDSRIGKFVLSELDAGALYPDPLVQVNPTFSPGGTVDDLVENRVVHEECKNIFRRGKTDSDAVGFALRLFKHQEQAISRAQAGQNYVLTTGTGSGKSLSYILPIVDYVLKNGSGKGIRAVIVYPMNALLNSQVNELEKYLGDEKRRKVKFAGYTGQDKGNKREEIIRNPPDILLTNYMMLELMLTRPNEAKLIESMENLHFIVLDELHTYRGRQGADVSLLVRRLKERSGAKGIVQVGTSATMATEGSAAERRAKVASVASRIFGAEVLPENVIGETLERWTDDVDIKAPTFIEQLRSSLHLPLPTNREEFRRHPLSIWIETVIGLDRNDEGQLIRRVPIPLSGKTGAAEKLSVFTGIDPSLCLTLLARHFESAANLERDKVSNASAFAVRLHQFFSPGIGVFSTLTTGDDGYLSLQGEKSAPDDPNKRLFPLAFCRSCGQPYFTVSRVEDDNGEHFEPRSLSGMNKDEGVTDGLLVLEESNNAAEINAMPEDWYEDFRGEQRIKRNLRDYVPQRIQVHTNGKLGGGADAWFIKTPLRVCIACKTEFGSREGDAKKLSVFGMQGRSTATTTLSISTINYLRNDSKLPASAKKLLSFTDNRQDASLQAGHLNDFVEIGIVRAGLYKACVEAGAEGLELRDVANKVEATLGIPQEDYAKAPSPLPSRVSANKRSLQQILGYRILRDLRRGVRINSPNLEQLGLLKLAYPDIPFVAEADDLWQGKSQVLVQASKEVRITVITELIDRMRQFLCIDTTYLDPDQQELMKQDSYNNLVEPWAFSDDEARRLDRYTYAYTNPDKRYVEETQDLLLTPGSWFGMYLKNDSPLFDKFAKPKNQDIEVVIADILDVLHKAGMIIQKANTGYQIVPDFLRWIATDPNDVASRFKNDFFEDYYTKQALGTRGITAREHTAQVPASERVAREQSFREGSLPILYCSPTMELGVDISDLNVVNMRNIPPTPANYAQRSGRAGRSGQPALVFSYCTAGSPHDQYYFRRPELMVAGSVAPPKLDLTNRDLIIAHIHSIWLGESGLALGGSLSDVVFDFSNPEDPSLELTTKVLEALSDRKVRERTILRARQALKDFESELIQTKWYSDSWIEDTVAQIPASFNQACERWRHLYFTALKQYNMQHKLAMNHSLTQGERNQADALRRDAKNQMDLLTNASESEIDSDFYSYRYLASEGFLPGYNFPRLPLSAFIPGRNKKKAEYLSRPRFLAISEFGPGAVVYHEGSRYKVDKVSIPSEHILDDGSITTNVIKLCAKCGYMHEGEIAKTADVCDRCATPIPSGNKIDSAMRLSAVTLKRRDKITCDEEERMRQGYQMLTGVRFSGQVGNEDCFQAAVVRDGVKIAKITYAPSTTMWRINLGWNKRKEKERLGYELDVTSGKWLSKSAAEELLDDDDAVEKGTSKAVTVVPYVSDTRNALMIEWEEPLEVQAAANLQAALKVAILAVFQIEDGELASEPLPNEDTRNAILLYESAEGGAGVLRRLVDERNLLQVVVKKALEICHFDTETFDDLPVTETSKPVCSMACYDCLMSYGNQRDHKYLDRNIAKDLLLLLLDSELETSQGPLTREGKLANLLARCDSKLEEEWLRFIDAHKGHLPTTSQFIVEAAGCKPDFIYRVQSVSVAVFIDGSHHDEAATKLRDEKATENLENLGWMVHRFHYANQSEWINIVREAPSVYGVDQ